MIVRLGLVSTGYHSEVSARSLQDETKQSVCVWKGERKHTFWLKKEVRLKERVNGRERALMMLKIGPWLQYNPQVNHSYSLLSTYLSPCPPISPLPHHSSVSHSPPPPHPDSTSFTTTYSKLPSSSHTHPVTINNWSHVSGCISKLWIHCVRLKPFLFETWSGNSALRCYARVQLLHSFLFEILWAFTSLHLRKKYDTFCQTAVIWLLCSLIALQSKVVHTNQVMSS